MSVLVTGATGAVGSAVVEALERAGHDLVPVARTPADGVLGWNMGASAPPPELDLDVGIVVHTAASTRWTMKPDEATVSNVRPLQQLLGLIDDRAHLVFVSTAYAVRPSGVEAQPWRNEYERSKFECEELLAARSGPNSILRPPLILGSDRDGSIGRFSGTFGLMQVLTSGLLAAVVGQGDVQIPVVPVNFVAEAVLDAVERPAGLGNVNLGSRRLPTMRQFVRSAVQGVNRYREQNGVEAIDEPPIIEEEAWDRFHYPFSEEYLTRYHKRAIDLMRIFGRYSTNPVDYVPDIRWEGSPEQLIERSAHYWCGAHPNIALRKPRVWRARS